MRDPDGFWIAREGFASRVPEHEFKAMPRSAQGAVHPYSFNGLYVDGEWRQGSSGETISSSTLSSGKIAHIIGADKSDVDAAYEAAFGAQPVWSAISAEHRGLVLYQAAEVMKARQDEIIKLLAHECGAAVSDAKREHAAARNAVLAAAKLSEETDMLAERGSAAGYLSYRRPVGVVAAIFPRCHPLHLSLRWISPAIALGNSVVVKPASSAPIAGGLLIARIFEEARLPPGVLNVVAGKSTEIGDYLVRHAVPRVIAFTGSVAVGRRVRKLAAQKPAKRLLLESDDNASPHAESHSRVYGWLTKREAIDAFTT